MKTHAYLRIMALAGLLSLAPMWAQANPGSGIQDTSAASAVVPPKSLYQRLGGVYAISVVVDDFIERLLVNDTLNANAAIDEARRRVPKQGLKFHVTALVCQATGGPCKYTGRGMKDAHAHLGISQQEWDAMLSDFRKTLNRFGVPAAEQVELVAIVNGTKADIVVDSRVSRK